MPLDNTRSIAVLALSRPASTSFSRRAVVVTIIAAAILLKIPAVLEGRRWAEDGLFLLDALRQPWWDALITPHTGYIDVVASGAMLIAVHVADLEHVALASVLIALAIQICPVVLLITSRCDWLRPRWVLVTALLLILTPPITEEVWLSPVTSQYHLTLCTALILAFETRTGPVGLFRILLLALAGLTGPGPALAAPLFVMRACLDRSWSRGIQAAVLSLGALIEIAIFCTHPEADRHLGIDASLLLHVFYVKHLLVPFLGPQAAYVVANNLGMASVLGQWPLLPVVVSLLALSGLTFAVLMTPARDIRWLYAAAVTMMVLSYWGALGGQAHLLDIYFGGRYYFAPQILMSLTLLGIARIGPVIVRNCAMVLVIWLMFVGIAEYFLVNSYMAQGPSWREQIALWRAEEGRAITLWPPSFKIELGTLSTHPYPGSPHDLSKIAR